MVEDRGKLFTIEAWEPEQDVHHWDELDLRWGRLLRPTADPCASAQCCAGAFNATAATAAGLARGAAFSYIRKCKGSCQHAAPQLGPKIDR